MEIVVNHLTRMQPGHICVAGIDTATGAHVRPVIFGRLSAALLARYGGPFDLAAVVALGPTHADGKPPEVEDQRFEPKRARRLRQLDTAAFWALLQRAARTRLRDIFGSALRPQGRACAVPAGEGIASLGCLVPAAPPTLALDTAGKPRVTLSDGALAANVSVTDLRLYRDDFQTPRRDAVEALAARITSGVPVIVSVGLTRPFAKDDGSPPLHWLQVNNLHLADDPIWRPA